MRRWLSRTQDGRIPLTHTTPIETSSTSHHGQDGVLVITKGRSSFYRLPLPSRDSGESRCQGTSNPALLYMLSPSQLGTRNWKLGTNNSPMPDLVQVLCTGVAVRIASILEWCRCDHCPRPLASLLLLCSSCIHADSFQNSMSHHDANHERSGAMTSTSPPSHQHVPHPLSSLKQILECINVINEREI